MIILSVILIIIGIILLNHFDLIEKYEKKFRGLTLSKGFNFQKIYKTVTPLKPLISPLKVFDITKKFPKIYVYNPEYFSPVRDQGTCGGCWAFVICSMLSDDVTIKLNRFGKNLNVQQLLSCYTQVDGCDGAAPEDALIWLQRTNFKITIDNQYLDKITKCVKSNIGISVKKNTVKSLCKFIKKENINNPTDEEAKLLKENIFRMKLQLIIDGPFFGSLSVYKDFFNFSGDQVYVKKSNEFLGGHAILVVGWCDKGVDLRKGFEEGYWICKNSWGKTWAPEFDFPGYFAIKMGVNECGIESRSGCAETNVAKISETISKDLIFNNYSDYLKHLIVSKRKRRKEISN